MDFSSFIRPYLRTVYLSQETDGEYMGGIWVPGVMKKQPFKAAIANFTDDILQYGEGGTYATDDEKLFTYEKLSRGQKVIALDKEYTVTEERDYSFYGKGLRMYVIRRDDIAGD